MRLIRKLAPATKRIEYFGAEFDVNIRTVAIATDENGIVYAYSERPCIEIDTYFKEELREYWRGSFLDPIAEVDPTTIKWKESLKIL